jgi:hypothetical protein
MFGGPRLAEGDLLSQNRSRAFQMNKMKTAITPTTISIQFWISKPRKVKCSIRKCTVPPPIFVQDRRFSRRNILFLYF